VCFFLFCFVMFILFLKAECMLVFDFLVIMINDDGGDLMMRKLRKREEEICPCFRF